MTATDDLLAAVMQADAEWGDEASASDYSGGTDYWRTILAAPLAEVARLQAIVTDLAAYDPVSDVIYACRLCGYSSNDRYAGDCLWRRAREALDAVGAGPTDTTEASGD